MGKQWLYLRHRPTGVMFAIAAISDSGGILLHVGNPTNCDPTVDIERVNTFIDRRREIENDWSSLIDYELVSDTRESLGPKIRHWIDAEADRAEGASDTTKNDPESTWSQAAG